MNGALMQDQWEAMEGGIFCYQDFRKAEAVPSGFVPVPPAVLSNRRYVYILELKEDE